jgi:hypothetical protein
VFTKAEAEAGVEMSATRDAYLLMANVGSLSILKIGGVTLEADDGVSALIGCTGPAYVPAGQKVVFGGVSGSIALPVLLR